MARKYKKRITKKRVKEITPSFCKDYFVGISYAELAIKYDISEAFVAKLINVNKLKKRGLGCKTKELWKNKSYQKHMSEAHKGNPGYWKGKKLYPHVVKMIKERMLVNPIRYWLGKECSHMRGKNNPGYVDGLGETRAIERGERMKTKKYRRWRSKILVRDNFTCQECGAVGGKLCAHHIKSYFKHPKLRYKMSNGTTLCKSCHYKTDNYGRKVYV